MTGEICPGLADLQQEIGVGGGHHCPIRNSLRHQHCKRPTASGVGSKPKGWVEFQAQFNYLVRRTQTGNSGQTNHRFSDQAFDGASSVMPLPVFTT